jgi:hypothetical protein
MPEQGEQKMGIRKFFPNLYEGKIPSPATVCLSAPFVKGGGEGVAERGI